jgi:hypothetical protein
VKALISSISSAAGPNILHHKDKGRLSKEVTEPMVQEAGEFASKDDAQRNRLEDQ